MDPDRRFQWAHGSTLALADQLEQGKVEPSQYEGFWGGEADVYSVSVRPFWNYVESRLHLGHVIAPLVWHALCRRPRLAGAAPRLP